MSVNRNVKVGGGTTKSNFGDAKNILSPMTPGAKERMSRRSRKLKKILPARTIGGKKDK